MKNTLILIEQVFSVAALILYFGGILVLVMSGGAQENDVQSFDSSSIRIIYLLLYIATFLLLVLRWKKCLRILSKCKWILLILSFVLFSLVWSFDRSTTLKDSFTLIGSSLFGVYLASRYSLKQQMNLLAWAFGIMIILSFIFAIALPHYGIMGGIHQGKWRGVFMHKNGLGFTMTYSSILFLILGYQNKKHRVLLLIGFILSFLLLLLSSSGSAILNLAILILAFIFFQFIRLPYLVLLPILIAFATALEIFYFWFITNTDTAFATLGKDATLTGRTHLWELVMDMIWKHPWLGYGYGGFWNGWDGESAYIWLNAGWNPTHPHNGFLEIILDLGFIGLGIFLLGFSRSIFQALYWVRISKMPMDIYPMIHMLFLILTNISESNLLISNRSNWILYISLSIFISEKIERKNKKEILPYHELIDNA